MPKYDVKIGDDFEIAGFEVESVDDLERLAALDERRQSFKYQMRVSNGVLAAFAVATSVATAIGWNDGTYDELGAVVAFGGSWVAFIVGRFIKKG